MDNFEDVRKKLIIEGKLWEDPDFPAISQSIEPDSHDPTFWLWKRPKVRYTLYRFTLRGEHNYVE